MTLCWGLKGPLLCFLASGLLSTLFISVLFQFEPKKNLLEKNGIENLAKLSLHLNTGKK